MEFVGWLGENIHDWCREEAVDECTSRSWQSTLCFAIWQVHIWLDLFRLLVWHGVINFNPFTYNSVSLDCNLYQTGQIKYVAKMEMGQRN